MGRRQYVVRRGGSTHRGTTDGGVLALTDCRDRHGRKIGRAFRCRRRRSAIRVELALARDHEAHARQSLGNPGHGIGSSFLRDKLNF